jgi:hypothetical protein
MAKHDLCEKGPGFGRAGSSARNNRGLDLHDPLGKSAEKSLAAQANTRQTDDFEKTGSTVKHNYLFFPLSKLTDKVIPTPQLREQRIVATSV